MRKGLYLVLCLLISFLTASELPLGNEFAWEVPKGHGTQKKLADGVVQVELTLPNTENAKDCWQRAKLNTPEKLDGWKNISFAARCVDKKNYQLVFYVQRNLSEDNWASFYRRVEISDQWQNFDLPLRREDLHSFRFAKGSQNASLELDQGGELVSWAAAGNESVVLQFKDLRLTDGSRKLSQAAASMAKAINEHQRLRPYEFQEIIEPAAVPVKGMVIDLRKDADETEQFAAAELAAYLQRITGDEFQIRGAKPGERSFRLRVVPGEPAEAFASECQHETLVSIIGNSPRALLYAVYDFLEKAAGVRFLMPLPFGEVVPKNPELKIPCFRDQDQPLMDYRCSHYCSNRNTSGSAQHLWQMADWAVKNRYNVELERIRDREAIIPFYQKRGGCIWLMEHAGHNFHRLIPPTKYFAEHPEYFCFDRATGEWRHQRAQLCTTNPDLIKELARIADDYFTRHPHQMYFPLFQEDGSRLWCQCPDCLALNPSGSNLASATENNINLANQLCAEIRRTRPDRGVWTYAYHITSKPPQRVMPVPGVRVMYCYYSDGDPQQPAWLSPCFEEIKRWAELTDGNLVIYTYHYLNPRYTFNDEKALINMFRMFQLAGIKGSNQECGETWGGIDGYLMYLGAKLAWNPWIDEITLKKDYFDSLYGQAGEKMRLAHDLLSEELCRPDNQRRFGFGKYPGLEKIKLATLGALVNEARQSVREGSREAMAVQAWQKFLGYVHAWSEALLLADSYYQQPDEAGYEASKAAVTSLQKIMQSLTSERILSLYSLRIVEHFQQSLDNSWRIEKNRLWLEANYQRIQNLLKWRFAIDPQAEGDQKQWHGAAHDDSDWKEIEAGKFWEEQGFPDYDGAGWYRCVLQLPEDTTGLALYFGGADEKAWVYLDGDYIGGQHEGDPGVLWQQPFTVTLPEKVAPGKHLLAVKVVDSGGGGGLWNQVLLVRKNKPNE